MPKDEVASTETRQRRNCQKLTRRLRQFMEEEQLSDGDKLPPERTLAEHFGVSRSSIREAIRALAEKGLLESRQGDGTYVRVPDVDPYKLALLETENAEGVPFEAIMECRRILEPGIAELAAVRHTQEQLNRLKIIACDQQRCLLSGTDDGALDAQFHLVLAECTGNTLLMGTLSRLNELYAVARSSDLRDETRRQFSVSSHLRIIDALERRSPADSRKALEEHLDFILHKPSFPSARD